MCRGGGVEFFSFRLIRIVKDGSGSGFCFGSDKFKLEKNILYFKYLRFSMKLRKHINNKRLEKISQMGVDRVIDLQVYSRVSQK